jgi:hypothetical protein
VHADFFHQPADEFVTNFKDAADDVKAVFMRGDYVLIYGWLQHGLRLRAIPDFDKLIDAILVYCRSPYRVVAPDVIAPVGSDQKAETIGKAFADLNSAGLAGGREHLKAASGQLSAGHLQTACARAFMPSSPLFEFSIPMVISARRWQSWKQSPTSKASGPRQHRPRSGGCSPIGFMMARNEAGEL